jgi:hypothetical protein
MSTDHQDLQTLMESVADIKRKIVEIEAAFPAGYISHREYHEARIREALMDANFVRELKLDAAKKGLWFFAITTAGLLLLGVQVKLRAFIGGQ